MAGDHRSDRVGLVGGKFALEEQLKDHVAVFAELAVLFRERPPIKAGVVSNIFSGPRIIRPPCMLAQRRASM